MRTKIAFTSVLVCGLGAGCAASSSATAPNPRREVSQQDSTAQARGGRWSINGVKLRYVIEGEGPTIVALHGGPGGNLGEMRSLSRMVGGYRWVFYDQRGSGDSERLPIDVKKLEKMGSSWISVERHVEDLEAIRAKLGVEKMILLGHSWGGALAAFFAAAHPARVEKLIIYNGGPMWRELDQAKSAAFRARRLLGQPAHQRLYRDL